MITLALIVVVVVSGLVFVFYRTREAERIGAKGKAVLITGCDTGFGHQLAIRAQSSGFLVFAGCLKANDDDNASKARYAKRYGEREGRETEEEEEEEEGEGATILAKNGCHVIQLDVTKQKEIDDAVRFVDDVLKENDCSLWAVVNNAGIALHCELEWCSGDDFRRILEVNSVAPFCVAKAFLPTLRRSRMLGTRVVNVASAAAYFTFPGLTSYAMSKHACRSLSDGMRREWKKFGVRVSSIEPTLYKTNITNSDNLVKKLKLNWSELSEETKASYGAKYLSNYEEMITNHYRTSGRSQIWEVIDALMDAITNINPKSHYHPGLGPKIRLFLLRCFPEFLIDRLLSGPPHIPNIE